MTGVDYGLMQPLAILTMAGMIARHVHIHIHRARSSIPTGPPTPELEPETPEVQDREREYLINLARTQYGTLIPERTTELPMPPPGGFPGDPRDFYGAY